MSVADFWTFPENAIFCAGVLVLAVAAIVTLRGRRKAAALEEPLEEGEPATPGAQRQIDEIRERVDHALRAGIAAVVLIVVGFGLTGWQVVRAFDKLESERRARSNAAASINTFLCQRIDDVGNGVAILVRASLRNSPAPSELTPGQRRAYRQFLDYAIDQERPPRCRELALKIATLTGADPDDIEITRIRLHPKEAQNSRSDDSPANP